MVKESCYGLCDQTYVHSLKRAQVRSSTYKDRLTALLLKKFPYLPLGETGSGATPAAATPATPLPTAPTSAAAGATLLLGGTVLRTKRAGPSTDGFVSRCHSIIRNLGRIYAVGSDIDSTLLGTGSSVYLDLPAVPPYMAFPAAGGYRVPGRLTDRLTD